MNNIQKIQNFYTSCLTFISVLCGLSAVRKNKKNILPKFFSTKAKNYTHYIYYFIPVGTY